MEIEDDQREEHIAGLRRQDMHLSLQRLLYLLALTRPVAAALQLYISSLYN
jgi:hypothetical protein